MRPSSRAHCCSYSFSARHRASLMGGSVAHPRSIKNMATITEDRNLIKYHTMSPHGRQQKPRRPLRRLIVRAATGRGKGQGRQAGSYRPIEANTGASETGRATRSQRGRQVRRSPLPLSPPIPPHLRAPEQGQQGDRTRGYLKASK